MTTTQTQLSVGLSRRRQKAAVQRVGVQTGKVRPAKLRGARTFSGVPELGLLPSGKKTNNPADWNLHEVDFAD